MKVIGKIGNIELSYQREKVGQDGKTYYSEKYTIFVESGDDNIMVDGGFVDAINPGDGLEALHKRGVVVGAVCEATIRFGFRDYDGKRYHDIRMVGYKRLDEAQPAKEA